jgi:hypothetical protein
MKLCRWLLAGAGLILLVGQNLARGADRVLVPGDPPLTQEVVDLYQQMWEWYCDVELTHGLRINGLSFLAFLIAARGKETLCQLNKKVLGQVSTTLSWRGLCGVTWIILLRGHSSV